MFMLLRSAAIILILVKTNTVVSMSFKTST